MIILHKVFTFCAAHRYWNEDLTPDENNAAFGPDVRLHGHNYTLTLSLTGKVNPATGFLVDLGHVKDVVKQNVVDVLDHSTIDQDIDWFENRQPSTENLVVWIWENIEPHLQGAILHRVRLQETPTIFTDYYGPAE